MTSDPRYPIGHFSPDTTPTPQTRAQHIEAVAGLPAQIRRAVANLNDSQIDTPYREGGWKVRQVVHHVADSHMNAYVRFKWALTEDNPTIKAYEESEWARLKDSELTPVEVSLTLIDSLHARWTVLLRSMTADDFARKFTHPESGPHDVDWLLGLYAWHGKHHTGHITGLRERMGW